MNVDHREAKAWRLTYWPPLYRSKMSDFFEHEAEEGSTEESDASAMDDAGGSPKRKKKEKKKKTARRVVDSDDEEEGNLEPFRNGPGDIYQFISGLASIESD